MFKFKGDRDPIDAVCEVGDSRPKSDVFTFHSIELVQQPKVEDQEHRESKSDCSS